MVEGIPGFYFLQMIIQSSIYGERMFPLFNAKFQNVLVQFMGSLFQGTGFELCVILKLLKCILSSTMQILAQKTLSSALLFYC